ncbi:M14 family metallopeptidase [Vibrio genomosp. F10]|uniref:Peptidase n=1 Tax=Vibrio genomosp. F10 str. ZF-129 TaxID=1187848 RepID=A0A1E5BJ12_9VIBR|nr:M14 family metallocarboxypeptidase [Vibrio genomosp. F10]OEE37469.1 peptidase [Vibrio genomosp. F10 str. ZF-129]OEE93042.1 peptidase [Vibrio genomosp. F10 str. 9ZC157]OEF07494.1 peptidase [Vibrio genomosp. F10 str. 9ZB36]
MTRSSTYHIGTPGQPWGDKEHTEWRDQTSIKREYSQDVLPKIQALAKQFDVEQYGALSYDPERYPLFCIKTRQWDENKPTVLITGGVHGYETSGVHGALKFVETQADFYSQYFNIVVAPCVSPWGYETINRWNPNAVDPNRSFYENSPSEESANLMAMVKGLNRELYIHVDLHETTDSDETEFRPALAARDGQPYIEGSIPDGFYTVGDTENPAEEFQRAVIQSVKQVTHIAPPDENNQIIGSDVVQHGVINYPLKALSLCGGLSHCQFGTTTEVYPDSEKVTDEECNHAQVAAIIGALDYGIAQL